MKRLATVFLAMISLLWGLAMASVLAGCGGSEPAAAAPGPVTQSPAQVPKVPDVGAEAPTAVAAWLEDWKRPLAPRLGGQVRHTVLDCRGSTADPDRLAPGGVADGAEWAPFPSAVRGVAWEPGRLIIDDLQRPGDGWALLSHWTTPPTQPVQLTGVIDLQSDRGAWISLTLIADESDYRSIAMRWHGADLWAYLYAPCYAQPLARLAPGPRSLALDYTPPPAPDCWRYRVDGQVLHTERCDHAGAPLRAPARPAIYVVNVDAEAALIDAGRVRAVVGPVVVTSSQ